MNLLHKARDLGFVGVFVDEKYGGMGMGFLESCLVMEGILARGPRILRIRHVHVLWQRDVSPFRHKRKKNVTLPGCMQRRQDWCCCVKAEPDAGSDVLAVSQSRKAGWRISD